MKKPKFIAAHASNPKGLLGRLILAGMVRQTSAENDHAIEILAPEASWTVIDIGTGHGHALSRLAKVVTSGKLVGIDQSETALQAARRRNAALIENGRLELHCCACDDIPVPSGTVDGAITLHTVYFLPRLDSAFAEFARILKPRGSIVVGFRPPGPQTSPDLFPDDVYRFRSAEEIMACALQYGLHPSEQQTLKVAGKQMTFLKLEKRHVS
ncbi:class I SAM-dependent methyltransferase [Parvibaculum sp.]|uniref:class I SAM-dependent methyltransferase n=1 Tax=Parvibaculum sp. TaxID=2024848 RepID=UPI0034A04AA6